jgi:hypothetical protein
MKRFLPAIALAWGLLPAVAQAQDVDVDLDTEGLRHQYVVSGVLGSTFGDDLDQPSVDFGGSLSYLFNGIVGGEFLANFGPDTSLEATTALAPDGGSWVNSYMVNAIVAAPVGDEQLFQPFVSGGVGAINLRLDDTDFGELFDDPDNLTDTQLGANIGAGVMGFRENWGFRGDVRWFQGLSDEDQTEGILDPNDLLADQAFWRANVGLSYRW